MGDVIPPKSTTKKNPEPELSLPDTKKDALRPSESDVAVTMELDKAAWEVFNIDNLPTISDEQMERYNKHVLDRRQVWIKSNIDKTSFPIRCRILEDDYKEGEEPRFMKGEDGYPLLIIKQFRYNPISIYQRERIVTMSAELNDLQRMAQALAIIKGVTKDATGGVDIKIDFEGLPTMLKNEDFTTIQSKLMKKQLELNSYRFDAYLNMSKEDKITAYWGDVRDWLDVCIEKEQHVLDPRIGVA